jgi:hypothetical protein
VVLQCPAVILKMLNFFNETFSSPDHAIKFTEQPGQLPGDRGH